MSVLQNKEDFIRELIYKSWHRGCKETDILLGSFAKNEIYIKSDDFLQTYSSIIQEPDWDIYAWIIGEKIIPAQYQAIVRDIIKYHNDKNK